MVFSSTGSYVKIRLLLESNSVSTVPSNFLHGASSIIWSYIYTHTHEEKVTHKAKITYLVIKAV